MKLTWAFENLADLNKDDNNKVHIIGQLLIVSFLLHGKLFQFIFLAARKIYDTLKKIE